EAGATAVGWMMGTLGYMPPEQLRGEWHDVDHRADLFALGAILYEILTDRRAFDGPTPVSIVVATFEHDPPPPRAIAPACPLVLEDLCTKLLQKRKEDRP